MISDDFSVSDEGLDRDGMHADVQVMDIDDSESIREAKSYSRHQALFQSDAARSW
jgi:hypothetical protein